MEGLSAICAGLGCIEEDENGNPIGYTKDEYCLDNLKDLLRFLRRDDPATREVFKQVCRWNIAAKDLIPIIEHCQDDRTLVLNAVKVLVFLTMPIEPTSTDIPQQLEYLWGLKSSITSSVTVAVIVSLLESPLENLECDSFTEEDWKLVQLVLTLFRNILAIQEITTQQKAGGMATHFLSLRDRFLELLFQENVMDLILVLSQHVGGSHGYLRQDNLLLLETFYYIFKGQDPELVAKAHVKGSKADGSAEASIKSLRSIMEQEQEKRKLVRLHKMVSNSMFTGMFTRLAMDGSKTLFNGNPCAASCDDMFRAPKKHRGPSKKMVWDREVVTPTMEHILELLHDFVNQFLVGGYNVLMQSVCEDIVKEHHEIQNSDIVVFFQVARFVTSFQYFKLSILKPDIETASSEVSEEVQVDRTLFKGNMCGPIAASINESMFQLVISKWRDAFDGLKLTNDYKFLSAAGSLMKYMIRMLDLVLKQSPEESNEPQTARILLYKLFYDQTDKGMTQFFLNLIKSFDINKQAKSDLADLVEIIHVVLRLMENLQARGTLRVSRKSRKKKMKRALVESKDNVGENSGDFINIQNEVVSGCEQSAHPSMPENDILTVPSCNDKEENITVPVQANEPMANDLEIPNSGSNMLEMESKKSDSMNGNDCYGTDDSSGDEQLHVRDEVDFNLSSLVSVLANNTIVRNLCWLLQFYKSNSNSTNHYIVCMLQRICDDLELSPMLYQISLLPTFYTILDEQKANSCKKYENIVFFLTTLVRRMMRKMKTNPLLFVEVLFWKTRKECHYINCQSMLDELGNLKKEFRELGTLPGDGDIGSSEDKVWIRRSIADALGEDEADLMMSHETDGHMEEDPIESNVHSNFKGSKSSREGKQSITSILNDRIDGKYIANKGYSAEQDFERLCKRRKPLILNEELEEKIKEMYEKYKDNRRCSHLIAEALDPDGKVSPVQVCNKLKQLGLKVPRKRRVSAGESEKEERAIGSQSASPNSNGSQDNSVRRPPLNRRKRVRAFSEDQEQMIKDLFEQFKTHNRCSYMIAKALDGGGTYTAAQVSHKLKQLGLHIPQQKSDTALYLRDEDYNDIQSADNSGDETLLSLMKRRSKNKHTGRDSEGEPVQGTSGNSSDSDGELLQSILEKTKKVLPRTQDRASTASAIIENNSYLAASQEGIRDEVGQSTTQMGIAENHKPANNAEADVTNISSKKQLGIALVDEDDNMRQQLLYEELADELADVGVDTTEGSQKPAASRRKLRMVIDLEDDD